MTSSDYGSYECVARNELGFSTVSPRLEVTSAPDVPTLLTVLNVTHDSVTLQWTPGFDGGIKASYRIRYRQVDEEGYKYIDVLPHNVTSFTIQDLEVNTQYVFSIMAVNKLGSSKYMPDLLSARTSSKFSLMILKIFHGILFQSCALLCFVVLLAWFWYTNLLCFFMSALLTNPQ